MIQCEHLLERISFHEQLKLKSLSIDDLSLALVLRNTDSLHVFHTADNSEWQNLLPILDSEEHILLGIPTFVHDLEASREMTRLLPDFQDIRWLDVLRHAADTLDDLLGRNLKSLFSQIFELLHVHLNMQVAVLGGIDFLVVLHDLTEIGFFDLQANHSVIFFAAVLRQELDIDDRSADFLRSIDDFLHSWHTLRDVHTSNTCETRKERRNSEIK